LNRILNNYRFHIVLLCISFTKIAYAVSRPVFESGPDANAYMPASIAFAKLGYFSTGIPFLPLYPTGYPVAVSFLIRIFGSNWIHATQIAQIFLFAIGAILIRETLVTYFPKYIGKVSAYLLILSPAWSVANTMAMYETLLFFYLSLSFYFFLKPDLTGRHKILNSVLGSVFSVLAISTHPRVSFVFLFLLVVYVYNNRTEFKHITLVIGVSGAINLLGGLLLAYLNFIRTGIFTLSTAFWASMSYNNALKGCSDFSCVASKIVENPGHFIQASLTNFTSFWSPHSGSFSRGSWFHNISILSQLDKLNLNQISIVLGAISTLVIFASWIFGTVQLWGKSKSIGTAFIFFTSLGFLLTDVLIYGDNRHRLMALMFMVPAHAATMFFLIQKVEPLRVTKFRRKVKSR
jgi:hypothetical protein